MRAARHTTRTTTHKTTNNEDEDEMAPTPQQIDVTKLLETQHEQVKLLFGKIGNGQGLNAADDFCELRRMLAVHETAEEEVVYPALRKTGAEGEAIADARLKEEAEAKQVLQQ